MAKWLTSFARWARRRVGASESLRSRGARYASEQLAAGRACSELELEADNPFDFNDFDRGMIDVLRNANQGE